MARKILVADDEQYMHRLMQYHLSRAGYVTAIARNGREAVEKAVSEAPDLVILDIMMPETDGLTALRLLKQSEATRHIPVIILTAHAHAVTREESEESGAAGFFTKPFSPTQLMLEIRRLLGEQAPG